MKFKRASKMAASKKKTFLGPGARYGKETFHTTKSTVNMNTRRGHKK